MTGYTELGDTWNETAKKNCAFIYEYIAMKAFSLCCKHGFESFGAEEGGGLIQSCTCLTPSITFMNGLHR